REARGELSERREPLGAAGFRFGATQLAIGFLPFFRENLQALYLAAIVHHEPVDQNGRDKKEEHPDGENGGSLERQLIILIVLQRRDPQRHIGEGRNRGPNQRGERTKVNRGAYHRQKEDGIVRAILGHRPGMFEQQSGQQNLDHDAIGGGGLVRNAH